LMGDPPKIKSIQSIFYVAKDINEGINELL
jgi:hypothetical protein